MLVLTGVLAVLSCGLIANGQPRAWHRSVMVLVLDLDLRLCWEELPGVGEVDMI